MLCSHDHAMHPAHTPGALREHDASKPCTPLFERLAIGMPKGPELRDRRKECLPLAPSDGKGWVSVSQQLEARGASIGGESTDAVRAEEAPAALVDLRVREALLALELLADRGPHLVRVVAPLQDGRQRERKLDGVGPLRIARVKVHLGAPERPRAASKLLGEHGDTGPVPRMADQACLDGIGHHVGELLEEGLVGQQSND